MPITHEEFKKLPKEDQYTVLKSQIDLLTASINNRMGALVSLSAISAALLVIATFNPNLVALTLLIRISISVLLLVIPFSIFIYITDLRKSITKNIKIVEDYLGSKISEQIKRTKFDKFSAWAPEVISIIILIIDILIIYSIWIN